MRGVTMTKVVGICFGLFALMAISTSTGSRQTAVKQVKLEQPEEKKVDVKQSNTIDLPAGSEGSVSQQNTVSEQTGASTNAMSTVALESKKQVEDATAQNKDVRVSISINVHKDEQVKAAVEEAAKEAAVKELPKEEVKEAVKEAKEEVKEEVKVEKKVKLPEEPVKAAAQPKPTKVVKPASASVLVIPLLAIAAALVAVKVRKPGYLPEAVEDKLESMGFPAQQRASHGGWKSSSRSMYGSV